MVKGPVQGMTPDGAFVFLDAPARTTSGGRTRLRSRAYGSLRKKSEFMTRFPNPLGSRGAMTASPGLGCSPSAPGPTWTPSYPGGAHRHRNRPTSEAKLPTTTTPASHGADTPPQVARLMVTG